MINELNYIAYLNKLNHSMLSIEEEVMLMVFLEANPHLLPEDDFLLKPDEIEFSDKLSLKKSETDLTDIPRFELLAIKKVENDLSYSEAIEFANDLSKAENKKMFSLYSQTIIKADKQLFFENRDELKRSINRIIPYSSWVKAISGVAAVAIIVITFHIKNLDNTIKRSGSQIVNHKVIEPKVNQTQVEVKQVVDSVNKQLPEKLPVAQPSAQLRDYLLEPEPHPMAFMQAKSMENVIIKLSVNGYEVCMNEVMDLYLNNQIEIRELHELYAEELAPAQTAQRKVPGLVKMGVKIVNWVSPNRLKLNEMYDPGGNMVAYRIKVEGMEMTQRVK